MATKMVSTKKSIFVYILVKSSNQKVNNKIYQSDEVISTHKTREGAEEKLNQLRPSTPTRSFTRYQIRKFLLSQ